MPTAAARSTASRLLALLHLLHLLCVPLLHLLCLLSVLLFLLLSSFRSGLLLAELLILFVLSLLELLAFLILPRNYLILLILVFLIHLCVSHVRSCALYGWQLIGMDRRVGTGGRSGWRRSVIRRKLLLLVIVGRPLMLGLRF